MGPLADTPVDGSDVAAWERRGPATAFRAHSFLREPHLQMLAGALLRSGRQLPFSVERLETPDSDFVDLAWFGDSKAGPLALLVHGIGGGLSSGYVHSMAAALASLGIQSVALQLRGAGPEPNRQAIMYHHGNTEDVRWLCRLLSRRFPGRSLCAVGWSMGASIIIKSLGEDAEASPLACAAAISAPLHLLKCAEHLSEGRARLYQSLMLRHVKGRVRRKYSARAPHAAIDVSRVLAARDFFEFGDALIAPLCGFNDAKQYCRRVNPGRYLRHVARPLLVLQAADDPLLGPAVFPPRRVSESVRVEVTTHGGHVGFVASGPYGAPISWLEGRIADYLDDRLRAP